MVPIMPRVRVKKPGAKPVPNSPAVEGNAGPEELKARKAERLAMVRQRAVDAAGPQPPIPSRRPVLLDDMLRAWQCPEHPLDGPVVVELRKIVREDFARFMTMMRDEEKRTALEAKAAAKAEGGVDGGGVDAGTAAALELIDKLLAEAGGSSTPGGGAGGH